MAECIQVKPDDIIALADFATQNAIDLTFVGGETSLALGIVDEFESRGLKIIGPCKEAAQLEASKSSAKDFIARHGVPTAKFTTSHSPAFAILELESGDFGDENSPVVVKADGLAAGKGVVVAKNRALMIERSPITNSLDQQATERLRLSQQITPPATRPTELIGEITAPAKPSKLKKALVLALAAVLGMMGGVMLAFVAEFVAKAKANAAAKS